MKRVTIIVAMMLFVALVAFTLPPLDTGMSPNEVVGVLGEPDRIDEHPYATTLWYENYEIEPGVERELFVDFYRDEGLREYGIGLIRAVYESEEAYVEGFMEVAPMIEEWADVTFPDAPGTVRYPDLFPVLMLSARGDEIESPYSYGYDVYYESIADPDGGAHSFVRIEPGSRGDR